MMRLDFASILDYGNSKIGEAQLSDKQKFVNMIDSIEDAKMKPKEIKAKTEIKA